MDGNSSGTTPPPGRRALPADVEAAQPAMDAKTVAAIKATPRPLRSGIMSGACWSGYAATGKALS
jgi:hypothetical protein